MKECFPSFLKTFLHLFLNSTTAKTKEVGKLKIGIERALTEKKYIPEEIDFHVTNLRMFWKLDTEPQGSYLIYLCLYFLLSLLN